MNDPGLDDPIADHAGEIENEADDGIDIGEGQAYIDPRYVQHIFAKMAPSTR